MKSSGGSRSGSDVGPAVRTRVDEATLCATEAGALRTDDALAFAVHIFTGSDALAARVFSRRGVLTTPPAATRRCYTDFRSVGQVEDELETSPGESALSDLGRDDATGSDSVETFVAFLRAPMKYRIRCSLPKRRQHLTMRCS